MKCLNEKCSLRDKEGNCQMVEDYECNMAAEDFVDNDTCGWINKQKYAD